MVKPGIFHGIFHAGYQPRWDSESSQWTKSSKAKPKAWCPRQRGHHRRSTGAPIGGDRWLIIHLYIEFQP